jgi:hypothetical protein
MAALLGFDLKAWKPQVHKKQKYIRHLSIYIYINIIYICPCTYTHTHAYINNIYITHNYIIYIIWMNIRVTYSWGMIRWWDAFCWNQMFVALLSAIPFSLGCGRWFARELAILDERCCPTCSATGWSRAFRHHRRLLVDGFSMFLQFLFWLVVSVLILNHLFGYVWDCLSISIPLTDVLQVVDLTFYPAFGMTSSLGMA